MEVHIGVDWARHEAVAVIDGPAGQRRMKIKRNVGEVRAMVAVARELGGPDATLLCAVESGDTPLAHLLHAEQVQVYVVDPKQAKRFGESKCSSGAKDDFRDAANLGSMLRSTDHRRSPWAPLPADVQAARLILSMHGEVGSKIQRAVNQLRARLVEVFPALERTLGELRGKSALAILDMAPTAQEAAKVDLAQFDALAKRHRMRANRTAQVRLALREPWVELDTMIAELQAKAVRLLVSELRELLKQLAQIDGDLTVLALRNDQTRRTQTVSGIGATLSVSLLAFGPQDEHKQTDARDRLGVTLGASPVEVSSGKSGHTRMRKSVPAAARALVHVLALQAVMRLQWAKAQYADLRARGKRGAHALRIVGRSLLRVLEAMNRTGTTYDDEAYMRRLQAHGVPWALTLAVESGPQAG